MKQTKIIMAMPITVELADSGNQADLDAVFSYFQYVEEKFSTFKATSEISRINRGEIKPADYSQDVKTVFELAEQTRQETNGYFDIQTPNKGIDPAGLVKGWAIYNAAKILEQRGLSIFYINAGSDIQAVGKYWQVGIKNPFKQQEIVKVIYVKDLGVATSGTYIRGQHIFNPLNPQDKLMEIVSLTVIGPNIYEADRFATAAFAMGKNGIYFIEQLKNFEGYMIDSVGMATMTSGFEKYTFKPNDLH